MGTKKKRSELDDRRNETIQRKQREKRMRKYQHIQSLWDGIKQSKTDTTRVPREEGLGSKRNI